LRVFTKTSHYFGFMEMILTIARAVCEVETALRQALELTKGPLTVCLGMLHYSQLRQTTDMKGKFHYRVNADGTIDSICLRCFLTAAKAENESDLHELEAIHQCDYNEPFLLTENLQSSRQS
jgi:hypothetical protein